MRHRCRGSWGCSLRGGEGSIPGILIGTAIRLFSEYGESSGLPHRSVMRLQGSDLRWRHHRSARSHRLEETLQTQGKGRLSRALSPGIVEIVLRILSPTSLINPSPHGWSSPSGDLPEVILVDHLIQIHQVLNREQSHTLLSGKQSSLALLS